jgi:hypothetical protein
MGLQKEKSPVGQIIKGQNMASRWVLMNRFRNFRFCKILADLVTAQLAASLEELRLRIALYPAEYHRGDPQVVS